MLGIIAFANDGRVSSYHFVGLPLQHRANRCLASFWRFLQHMIKVWQESMTARLGDNRAKIEHQVLFFLLHCKSPNSALPLARNLSQWWMSIVCHIGPLLSISPQRRCFDRRKRLYELNSGNAFAMCSRFRDHNSR
ncbi:hypothetical protein CEXT_444121 [Caerostris extrusa]|uniref:Uncharacterized protein n=1 Tax=Caerostris extrusa TaxID=172846 RepID=A0AAV4P2Y5_CAEEX|nr:hypothetical protein CEXT_444121 [Caerostris extrusa]